MATSKDYVQNSYTAEDNNKRKALEYVRYVLLTGQLSHQDSKGHGYASSETSGEFPQKKQKLASPHYRYDFYFIPRKEYDL
jgi:hypothetical protein